jgi:hypothetical protein
MKKTKLHLRRTTIARLTRSQLDRVIGAGTGDSCIDTGCCAGTQQATRNDPNTNPMCMGTQLDCLPPPDSCWCEDKG